MIQGTREGRVRYTEPSKGNRLLRNVQKKKKQRVPRNSKSVNAQQMDKMVEAESWGSADWNMTQRNTELEGILLSLKVLEHRAASGRWASPEPCY